MAFDLSGFFNFAGVASLQGAEAVVAAFMIGVLFAAIIKHLFRLGVLIGLLVAVLVVTGVVSINLQGAAGSGVSIQSVYALASSIWGFLSQFAKAIGEVFAAGGVDGLLAAIGGFALGWFGLGFVPLRRRD